jgi:hypothetical protein
MPNTACSRQVGLGAFFGLLPGLEFFPAPQPRPRSAHLRLTPAVGQLFPGGQYLESILKKIGSDL